MGVSRETQTIGIGFFDDMTTGQDYNWVITTIPVPSQIVNGKSELVTLMNLDHIFVDRSTSIRFKGYTANGRPLYLETNLPRKYKQNKTIELTDFYKQEQYRRE